MDKKYKSGILVRFLRKRYVIPKDLRDPFRVLISCLISQRTKDEKTEVASKNLFSLADDPEEISNLSINKIQKAIGVSGFYNTKSFRIREICKILVRGFGGEVPQTRKELMDLPGIGPKCADIVLMYGFGKPAIAVDTHVNRIPKRLGLVSPEKSEESVKMEMEKLIAKEKWFLVNHGLVQFGKEICRPVSPLCSSCPINYICDYYKSKGNKIV